jgi:hypothetical protein
VPEDLMSQLAKGSVKLAKKIRTLMEVNLDFKVWQDNICKIPCNVKQITQLLDRDRVSPSLVERLS